MTSEECYPRRADRQSTSVTMPRPDLPMTDKQREFILWLMKERALSPEQVDAALGRLAPPGLDRAKASAWISRLLTLPVRVGESTSGESTSHFARVPDGRYAVEVPEQDKGLMFYVVRTPTEGKWTGYTFVDVQASDETYPIKNKQARREILVAIAKDPEAASKRYGLELGHCGVCGRTLTRAESITAGIGPVCAGKKGW